MTRTTSTSGKHDKNVAAAPVTATGPVEETGDVRQYAAAFARVRLVRAWVAVAAAIVAVLSTCLTLVERFAK